MKAQSDGAGVGAKVSARIREFSAARGLSAEALARAAGLSPTEIRMLEEGSDDITKEMVERIADVFGVHQAALCMFPGEHALANLLERHRDLPKDEFQKLAAELISKGFQRSKGST
jgi:transcriptional regulator with XRE-family HTH domain